MALLHPFVMIWFCGDNFVITLVQFQCCFCFVIHSVRLRSFSLRCCFVISCAVFSCRMHTVYSHFHCWHALDVFASLFIICIFKQTSTFIQTNDHVRINLCRNFLFLSKHFCMFWAANEFSYPSMSKHSRQTHWKCVFHICSTSRNMIPK